MSAREKREEILGRVRRGEMSITAAERWAAENGQIFSTKPEPARFDPMAEAHWTLPMTAAWIVERSEEKVREHWDSYRGEWRDWEFCQVSTSEDRKEFGSELRVVGPSDLFQVFGSDDPFDGDMRPFAHELCFALKSGQLSAIGLSRAQQSRSPISKFAWRGPFLGAERKAHHDAIYAIDADVVDDDAFYGEVQLPRDEVMGIWAPLTPTSTISSTTDREQSPSVKLVPTLPPGFDRPDWNVEHVLAWLSYRDMARLRALELANANRPKWYGRTYRHGFIDARSENILRRALITEKLIGKEGEKVERRGGWWRERSLLKALRIWFRRDHVLQRWPEQGSQRAQPIETGRQSQDDSLSRGDSSAPERGRADDGRSPPKNSDASKGAVTRRGARAKKSETLKEAMAFNFEKPEHIRPSHRDEIEKELAAAHEGLRLAVTVKSACRLIGVGNTKMWSLIKEGKVDTTRVGRRRLVLYSSLKALLAPDSGARP